MLSVNSLGVNERCIIHQIRNSLRYVSHKDRKAFVGDLKTVYQAPNRETAETNLLKLGEQWGQKYAIPDVSLGDASAVRSWENNWAELSTFFDYPVEIHRLIYTTNTIEGYNRQLRKVITPSLWRPGKNKASFPTVPSVRKMLYLANVHITKKMGHAHLQLGRDPQSVGHSVRRTVPTMNFPASRCHSP